MKKTLHIYCFFLLFLGILFSQDSSVRDEIEFENHWIANEYGYIDVKAVDINSDGLLDIVAATADDKIEIWIQNSINQFVIADVLEGNAFSGLVITFQSSLDAADMNGDGHIDILVTFYADNYGPFVWLYLNSGSEDDLFNINSYLTYTQFNPAFFEQLLDVHAADLDGDGDMDFIAGGIRGIGIPSSVCFTWWQNGGGTDPEFGSYLEIGDWNTDLINRVSSISTADIDGDGDLDILAETGFNNGENGITWWENNGDEEFTQHIVADEAVAQVEDVTIGDIDGDGDMDIASIDNGYGEITWWENVGWGTRDYIFEEHIIASDEHDLGLTSIDIEDIDSDGDNDIVWSAYDMDNIVWYDNRGEEEPPDIAFAQYSIEAAFETRKVQSVDMNNDGDIDIVSAGESGIMWHENLGSINNWFVSVDGSDLNVGNEGFPFATIQHGIDAADDGQIVMVAPGTYHGVGNIDLDFDGKAITLMSEEGAEQTIIDCGSANRGFTFEDGEDSTSVLDGFTITNGSRNEGGGIYCYYSSPAIKNCIISGNYAMSKGGGLFLDDANGFPSIVNCEISNNYSGGAGGGIYLSNSQPIISNSLIQNNIAHGGGGGIAITNNTSATIRNVHIIDNQSNIAAGGATNIVNSQAIFYYSLFANNVCNENAGAINMFNSNVELNNVTMANNSANWYGGAIYLEQVCGLRTLTTLSVHNSIISQNTAGNGGDNIYSESCEDTNIYIKYSNVDMTNSDIGDGNLITFGYSINEDPLFIDAENDDYNLLSNSPCIDTGSTDESYWGDSEITEYNGSAPDMGAFEYVGDICPDLGDMNGDGGYNVLDIVTLVNCVLNNNCAEHENGCAGDLNGDGGFNVLDVVTLVNCVLNNNCGG